MPSLTMSSNAASMSALCTDAKNSQLHVSPGARPAANLLLVLQLAGKLEFTKAPTCGPEALVHAADRAVWAPSVVVRMLTPVALAPGRLKLAASPRPHRIAAHGENDWGVCACGFGGHGGRLAPYSHQD